MSFVYYKSRRIKRFKLKDTPHMRVEIYKRLFDLMLNNLKAFLISIHNVEIRTMQIYPFSDVKLVYYIAFAKEIKKITYLHNLVSAINEFLIKKDKWLKRGLDDVILNKLIDVGHLVGFYISHILDKEKLIQKSGFFDYSRFELSHFY